MKSRAKHYHFNCQDFIVDLNTVIVIFIAKDYSLPLLNSILFSLLRHPAINQHHHYCSNYCFYWALAIFRCSRPLIF